MTALRTAALLLVLPLTASVACGEVAATPVIDEGLHDGFIGKLFVARTLEA